MNSTFTSLPDELRAAEDLDLDLGQGRHFAVRRYHVDFSASPVRPGTGLDARYAAKPLVLLEKQAWFPEIALLAIFARRGWQGVWSDAAHRKYFDKMPTQSKGVSLTTHINQLLARIAENNGMTRSGCWDLILWENRTVAFVAVKSAARGVELRDAQVGWLKAALKAGLSIAQFLVVEWDYRKVLVKRKRPAST